MTEAPDPDPPIYPPLRNKLPLVAWWIALGALILVVDKLSDGILERGDGVNHFQIAVYSWKYPVLFLDMWGKPLFTLLASPFAQFGMAGMTLFNALCFIGTAWAADGILKGAGNAARWLFPPVLLLVPVYGTMVLAGMTEILFGLLTMLAVRAAYDERPVVFALIVSVMPFSRPEYIGFLPFALIWLCWRRFWNALPFLLAGNLVFAFFAGIMHGEPLWIIYGNPYLGAADIYGSGPFDHFIQHLDLIYGTLCFPLGIAIGLALANWRSGPFRMAKGRSLVWFTLLPAIAILLIHSYLWWKGIKGSLGLFRVLATTAPMLALFTCWILVRTGRSIVKGRISRISATAFFGVLYLSVAISTFLSIRPLPVPANEQEGFINMMTDRIKQMMNENTRVGFQDPYIGFRLDVDPFSDHERATFHAWRDDLGLEEGDLVIWDAHYSANEARTPLETLIDHPQLRLVEYREIPIPMRVLGGRQFAVAVFERRDTRHWSGTIDIVDQEEQLLPRVPYHTNADLRLGAPWDFGSEEFPLTFEQVAKQHSDMPYVRIDVSGTLHMPPGLGPLTFVFTEFDEGEIHSYKEARFMPGKFNLTFHRTAMIEYADDKLYIWNTSGTGFSLTDLRIQVYMHRSSPL